MLAPSDEPSPQPVYCLAKSLQHSALLGVACLGFLNPFFQACLIRTVIKRIEVHKILSPFRTTSRDPKELRAICVVVNEFGMSVSRTADRLSLILMVSSNRRKREPRRKLDRVGEQTSRQKSVHQLHEIVSSQRGRARASLARTHHSPEQSRPGIQTLPAWTGLLHDSKFSLIPCWTAFFISR